MNPKLQLVSTSGNLLHCQVIGDQKKPVSFQFNFETACAKDVCTNLVDKRVVPESQWQNLIERLEEIVQNVITVRRDSMRMSSPCRTESKESLVVTQESSRSSSIASTSAAEGNGNHEHNDGSNLSQTYNQESISHENAVVISPSSLVDEDGRKEQQPVKV